MEQYMELARMLAAQCWCDKETSGTEMDTVLAEAIARRISIWMETAYQMARNADFYRGTLDECAKHFGEAAYTADDGTVMGEPLLLKVPELVAALVKACEEANDTAKLRAEVARLKAALKKANEQAEHFEREWYLRGDARTLNSIARQWQPMKTAPRDGSIVLVLLDGVDYPHPAYWLTGPDSQRAISNGNNAPGWRMALDAAPIADHDGPRYWMDCPDAPDDGGPEDA
jgi:hypothetical protein